MKKFFKPSYIVLLVFIFLGIFVLFIDKGKREKAEKISIFTQGVKEEDITKIELIDIEKKTYIICNKSQSGVWEITIPNRYDVDNGTITGIISNFTNIAVDREISMEQWETEAGIDLKNFGLDNPKFKIKVTSYDNKENVLIVGNLTPTQNLYYAKDQHRESIYTVYSYCIEGMRKDLKSLRNKIIIDFDIEKVSKLTIHSKSETKEFVKKKDKWFIVSPVKKNAIGSEVENVLRAIKNLRADDFPDDEPKDLAKFGLDKPEKIVKIYDMNKKEKVILLGKRDIGFGNLYVKIPQKSYIYSVSSSILNSLDKKIDEFVEKEEEKKK